MQIAKRYHSFAVQLLKAMPDISMVLSYAFMTMKQSFLFLILLLISISIPIQKSNAQEFYVGVEDVPYYPLFEFKSDRNTFSKELLDSFAASKGYTFIYVPLPIKRFDKWLLEEKIDFKFPDNSRWYPDPSLKNKYTFSDSVIKLVAGTTVLKSSLNKSETEFKSVGTLLGFYPTTWIKQIESGQVKLHEDISTKILVRQLLEKHVDGIDIEPSVIQYYLKELGEPLDIAVIDKKIAMKYMTIIFLQSNTPTSL